MVAPAAALGAVVSVAASAATFVLLYSVGGVVPIPFDTLLTAMLGVHVLIGIGEAVITFVVVAGIVSVRPDLVHGARRLVATASWRPGRCRHEDASPPVPCSLTGLVVALVVAGVVSHYASASPDGLNRVAGDLGFASAEQASGGGPLAGYEVAGVDHARFSGGLAGVLGCLVVLGLSSLLVPAPRSPDAGPGAARARGRVMGAPHGHRLHFHGHSPLHRAPAHLKVAGLVGFMLVVVATPAGVGRPPSRRTPSCSAVAGRRVRRPRALPRAAHGHRDPGAGVRRGCCRSSPPDPRSRSLGLSLSEPGLVAAGGLRHQGHPRCARQPAARRHDGSARPARRARAARRAGAAGADHGVHGPLPRRRHRRAAPDEDRPRVPRVHRPRPAALAGARPLGRAPCSSAPSSAASGCTSR